MKARHYTGSRLRGPRFELIYGKPGFPDALSKIPNPPKVLYGIGDASALKEGIAIVGARKATPYGRGCARRFAGAAAERGIVIISGGARGCDAQAHRAALDAGGITVAFLGGGCDEIYPAEHLGLFQDIIDAQGAVVSEYPWEHPPMPYGFRLRNRLIAGLARATLIVEAGLPSGTFSTADEALGAGKEVLVVPGAITSASSRGANRLLYQGAIPIVDDESFQDVLFSLFGLLKQETMHHDGKDAESRRGGNQAQTPENEIIRALQAEPMHLERLFELASQMHPGATSSEWLMEQLADAEMKGVITRYPDGRYGPQLKA